jgi:nitrate reductase NapE component
MDDRDLPYEEHERRFRRQVRNFLTIIVVLFAINAVSNWGGWWFQWPALGLGIALAFGYKRLLDARDDAPAATPVSEPAAFLPEADDDLTRRAEALAERERQSS